MWRLIETRKRGREAMHRRLAVVMTAAVLWLGSRNGLAQGSVTVPRSAETLEGSLFQLAPFGFSSSRLQLLVASSLVNFGSASIDRIEFRQDNRNPAQMPATTVTDLVVELSHTSVTPANLSQTFAQNITEPVITVFTGPVALPAYTPSGVGAAPWRIAIPFASPFAFSAARGNLLIEVKRRGPPSPFPEDQWLDAFPQFELGEVMQFGTRGPLPRAIVDQRVLSGGSYVPGGSFDLELNALPNAPIQGVVLVGARAAVSVDLGVIGAPGNSLHVVPVASVPFTIQSPVSGMPGRFATVLRFDFPRNPELGGQSFAFQPFVFGAGLSALELAGLEATEVRLRGVSVAAVGAPSHLADVGVSWLSDVPPIRLFGNL